MAVTEEHSADETIVVAIALPFDHDPAFEQKIRSIDPRLDVRWTPYVESPSVRSEKGKNGGHDPSGLPTPPISDEMRAAWADTHVVFGMDLPSEASDLLPQMRWFQGTTAGVDQFDLAELRTMQVRLTTASGVGAVSIAEFVMARLLQVYKHLRTLDRQQAEHDWNLRFGEEVAGRTLGVIGLGAIGREVARRARAFGMTVLATRASATPGDTDPDVDELHPSTSIDDVVARCHVVVAALPSNPTTDNLFDESRFAAMRDGTVFCNVGRGAHVDEDALIAALRSGRVRAAILDVTRIEPLPADNPLWDMADVYISPHSSVSLDRYADNVKALAIDNLVRYLRGDTLRNEVDLTR